MDRISTATKSVDLFGAGKHGFKDGNLGLGIAPTDFNAAWFNDAQEELLAIIEGAGIVAAAGTRTQVRQAIKRLLGGNSRTITAAGPTALTADDAGLVILDATSNAVTVTLPAANAVTGVPLAFDFLRIDSTANAVTVQRAGADTFVGGATSFTLTGQGDQRSVRSDATSKWGATSTPTPANRSARAWVNFNGTLTGTISPRSSYNVTSITKNGAGDYTINFTNALPDANYAAAGLVETAAINSSSGLVTVQGNTTSARTTTSHRIQTGSVNSGATSAQGDVAWIEYVAFGG